MLLPVCGAYALTTLFFWSLNFYFYVQVWYLQVLYDYKGPPESSRQPTAIIAKFNDPFPKQMVLQIKSR